MSLYDQFIADTANIEPFSVEWFRSLAFLVEDVESAVPSYATLDFGTFLDPLEFSLDMGTY